MVKENQEILDGRAINFFLSSSRPGALFAALLALLKTGSPQDGNVRNTHMQALKQRPEIP